MTVDPQQSKRFLAEHAYAGAGRLNTRLHIQEHYGTCPVPWFRWVFDRFEFPAGGHVLDVGSGPGHVWWRNSGQLPGALHLFLGDLSQEMVKSARDNLPGAGLDASFLCLDCEHIPFADAAFDAVVALGVMDHLPDRQQGLAEIERVLRPGGELYVSGGGRTHLQEIEELVAPFLPEIAYGGAPDRFGLENGAAQLSLHFSGVQRHVFEDSLHFREAEPIIAYAFSEGQVAEMLTGSLRREFREAVRKRLARQGGIRVTRQKGLFVARKGEVVGEGKP